MWKRKWEAIFLIVSLFTLFFSVPSVCAVASKPGKLEVHFLTVSEGEATLIKTCQGKAILLDGGGINDGEKVIKELQNSGVKNLDLVVATHPHSRNIGGLIKVLEKLPVGQIIDSGINYNSEVMRAYKEVIEKKKITVTTAQSGLIIPLDTGVEMEFLSNGGNGDADNSSIVCRLTYGKTSFLFTGDVGPAYLANTQTSATFLKVSQRGGTNSLSEEFLSMVKPKEAIIFSTEKNSYTQDTKELLKKHQVKVHLITAQDGLTVITDGTTYKSYTNNPSNNSEPSAVVVRPVGKHIIISRSAHTLSLYINGELVKQYKVAVGKPSTPTPLGRFSVVNKIKHPPKPCFGVRWLGFYPTGWPSYGIHGTDVPSSIGHSVSHGCVRLHNEDVLELYKLVETGTPITIIK